MVLARIFSRYPQQAAALSLELQQKGFTVEVLSPEQTPATPAHLEIQLEACQPDEVLQRAEELASQLRADIAVAPGALPEDPVSSPTPAAPELNAAASEPAIPPAALETPAQPVSSLRHVRAARASGAALAACAAAAADWLVSAQAAFHERLEQARILAAEASARRQECLMELARRRAEARQRAFTAESSRRALAVYLLQLQSEYPLPDAVLESATDPASATGSAWQTKIKRLHMTKWEALLAAAASATALFVAGLAVASFRSRPTPSAKPDVSLQSSGVNLQGPQQKPSSPSRPSPAQRNTKPRPVKHKVRPKPQPMDRDLIARDVVVRHFPTPKPTPSPQTNGWKHFSDLSH